MSFKAFKPIILHTLQKSLWPISSRSRLSTLGVTTIGALAAIPLPTLPQNFGEAHGRYLHEAAQGIDETPLITAWELPFRKTSSVSA